MSQPFHPGPAKRKQRIKAGVGLRELAREMRVSAMYVVDLERGTRRFTEDMKGIYDNALTKLGQKQPSAGLPA